MSFNRKQIGLALLMMAIFTIVLIVIKWELATSSIEHKTKVIDQTPLTAADHELVSVLNDGQIIKNENCSLTFKIPKDWRVQGILGESKILSPEDEQTNEAWIRANQSSLQDTEGENPGGPDARSLYVSCQYGIDEYLHNFANSSPSLFKGAEHLADIFNADAFQETSLNPRLVKIIKIGNQDAYEIAETGRAPNGTVLVNYTLVLEGKRVVEIQLGQKDYANLPVTTKQIVQSIELEK